MTPPSKPTPRLPKLPRTTTKRKRAAEDVAADIVDDAVREKKPRPGRKRQPTPENAESIEIVSAVVTMSDLCRDLRTGKTSKREMELRNMDSSEMARKRKEREEKRKNSTSESSKKDRTETPKPQGEDRLPNSPVAGPKMRIVNGEIVIDSSSLQIDRHADADRNADDMEEVVENPLTRRINAASFGKRTKLEVWDEEMTDLFYKGLRMFGTDFMMISKMFPGRTRRHIKLKFSNEERRYPAKIKQTLLGPRELVDLDAYSEITNTVYDDPKIIQKELDADKKRIEDDHFKEQKAREDLLRNPSGGDNVLPSIENDANGGRRRPRLNQGKKGAKAYAGGKEEILGTIDDF